MKSDRLKTWALALFAAVLLAESVSAQSTAPGGANSNSSSGGPSGGPTGAAVTPSPQISGHAGLSTKSKDRNAPRRENITAIKLGTSHLNALVGGFEMGAGFPFGIELTTAEKLPGVELRARAFTSSFLYRRLELGVWVPRLGDEKTHLDAWFSYRLRTRDDFFGLGEKASLSPESNYASDQRSYNVILLRDLAPTAQIGLFSKLATSNGYPGFDTKGKDVPLGILYSTNPASANWLPGLHVGAKTISTGAFAEIDRRNNESGLTRGAYFYGRIASIDGLATKSAPGFGWLETELDGHTYLPLGGDATSLALRAYASLKDPKGESQIPFYELSWLGGRNHNRGFRNFRFRANNSLLLSIEPRRTIWKQSDIRGLDLFAFTDAGKVWGDNRPHGDRTSRFSTAKWKAAVGGGLQYRLNKTTAFRIDYGHSNEANRLFFSVSRGF